MNNNNKVHSICIVGLGYVGLPLAVEFGKIYSTLGFDIDDSRIKELSNYRDRTGEVSYDQLKSAKYLQLTSDSSALDIANIYIVTVPTPIDKNNIPDLELLKSASQTIGTYLKHDDIVIYESTVFPGATEEICVPILEQASGLKLNDDFSVGYSPERINPGDKVNTIRTITKITSGSNAVAANKIDNLYRSIIDAGTYLAHDIKTAEAAKVIENTQRDLNIAIINEFSKIFNCLDIDTESVLNAAATKWNFLQFKPGLVGGHCIGVDPHYLAFKAIQTGYHPELILAGRRMNETMSIHCAHQMIKAMACKNLILHNSRVLVMGITFKGNCPDIRNTKVIDLVRELKSFNLQVDIYDPCADPNEVYEAFNVELTNTLVPDSYDGIILAVDHTSVKEMGQQFIRSLGKDPHVLFDMKYLFAKNESDLRM